MIQNAKMPRQTNGNHAMHQCLVPVHWGRSNAAEDQACRLDGPEPTPPARPAMTLGNICEPARASMVLERL
jgi:hypothetical protein